MVDFLCDHNIVLNDSIILALTCFTKLQYNIGLKNSEIKFKPKRLQFEDCEIFPRDQNN